MLRLPKPLSIALSILTLIAFGGETVFAHWSAAFPQSTKSDAKQDKKEKRRERRARKEKEEPKATTAKSAKGEEETLEVVSDRQSKNGDIFIYEGYVNATLGDIRLQADRVTYNSATGDMVAEGNVIFDQGADQRVTARRAEINTASRRGVFWDTTGFTNRTQTGDYVFFTAARVEKTGLDTYELYDADVTACEDAIPKWSFGSKHAELKLGDRVILHNAVFHVKKIPAFILPYAWIPATRNERKSGFLLPNTGTSNQKGRTLKLAYYQTLGQSADITFRNDIYTSRGLGFGAEFRAQTDEKSYMRMGVFAVKDRLFGQPGESQGGTAFVAEGIQYLPHGWLAVGNVSLVTSLRFRQVFSDDISQVIDPRRESTFYANNNGRAFSFNFLASNETTTVFRPNQAPGATPGTGSSFDIIVRQAPEMDLTVYSRRIIDRMPIYFSMDSSVGALKREETVDNAVVFVTPAAVQRFDFQPKITVPLATFKGIAVTPSLSLRQTFYTSSMDPNVERFDPEKFATSAADPRLDPTSAQFKPGLRIFDRNALDPIIPENISRHYAELAVDIRPPALEKEFVSADGSPRFKHLIEPYITYRLIKGIGDEFARIIRFDDRDAVANTNEFEYAIVNRFYVKRDMSELTRKRSRKRNRNNQPDEMEPVQPGHKDQRKRKGKGNKEPAADATSQTSVPNQPQTPATEEKKPALPAEQTVQPSAETKTEAKVETSAQSEKKQKLAAGERAELNTGGASGREKPRSDERDNQSDTETDASAAMTASNEDAPAQAYEFLTVKVAQKYFFDRNFGGALIEGRRNQFYPINTLSGFTFGGRARSFSPVNVAMRYRPLSSVYADLRMDVGSDDGAVRNIVVGGGVSGDKLSASVSYYLSRRIEIAPNSFEAGTFPGNQIVATFQFGDANRGWYGGTRIGYDFTDRFISADQVSKGNLRNSRSYVGYAWDCCGVQFNYNTFKAGLRNESAFSFTFTLAGLGSFGTDQFSQLGGGRGARKRGKRARRNSDDDLP